jgi:preprotein translocase subunit SecE
MTIKDRSELSKLYPSAKSSHGAVATDTVDTQAVSINSKLRVWQVVSVATLLFFLVDILVLFANYLRINLDWLNIDLGSLIQILFIPTALIIGVLIAVIYRVSKIIRETNINNSFFLIVYSLCLLPISQLIYDIYSRLNDRTVYAYMYSILLYVVNLVIVYIIMYVINYRIKTGKAQSMVLVFSIFFCIFTAVIDSLLR